MSEFAPLDSKGGAAPATRPGRGSLSQSVIIGSLDRVTSPKYGFGTFYILKHMKADVMDPNIYAKASSELLATALGVGWIITGIFRPDVIESNPLKDRIGYNNVCVGWDMEPASYVSSFFVSFSAYCSLRFAFTSIIKYDLMLEKGLMKGARHFFATASLYYYGFTIACVPIILVCQPTTNVWLHSLFFLNVILSRAFITIFAFLTSRGSLDSLANKLYLVVYTFVSFMIPILVFYTFILYDSVGSRAPDSGFLPVWVIKYMDITWFVCLATTAKFLPNDFVVKRDFDLVMALAEGEDEKDASSTSHRKCM